jgi:hypothetical protein
MCLELSLVNGWRFQSLHRSRNPLIIDARGIDLIADLIEESLAELTSPGRPRPGNPMYLKDH